MRKMHLNEDVKFYAWKDEAQLFLTNIKHFCIYLIWHKSKTWTCFSTWTLHAVAQVDGQVVHDVQQELEVVDVVHVDVLGVGGDGPQLVLIGVLHT